MSDISVFILTFNEAKHLERCIFSIKLLTDNIYVIDSFSSDETVNIARSLGARVYQNQWSNHANQVNWAIDNCDFKTNWIMRLDADEIITSELANELHEKLPNIESNVTGLNVKRKVYFMGKWIRFGGYYPTWLLRIWRRGNAICEQRIMDEHIKLIRGDMISLECDLIDENKNNLTWWTEKHNNYATKEAFELLNYIYNIQEYEQLVAPKLLGVQAERKRFLKYYYAKLPLFVRPFLYFIYRYLFCLGFLDGKAGLIWHFLQGFWYRFLVDAKIYDVYRQVGKNRSEIIKFLNNEYGVKSE